jgi:hypothetical protein
MTISDVTSMIVAIATVGSLLYISRQVNVTRQQTKGQFLLALDQQFEKTTKAGLRLIVDPNYVPIDDEWFEIWAMMSIYERISIMVEDKILDAGLVDRLYGFRLLALIANDAVYQRLSDTGAEWQDFIDLCYSVAAHRQRYTVPASRDMAFVERVHKLNKHSRSTSTLLGF